MIRLFTRISHSIHEPNTRILQGSRMKPCTRNLLFTILKGIFAGLFIAVLLVGGLINYLLGKLVETTGLSGTDRLLGGVFGAARGLALVVVLLLVCGFTPIPADPWWKDSATIQRMMPLVDWSASLLPESVSEHLDFEPGDDEEEAAETDEETQDEA